MLLLLYAQGFLFYFSLIFRLDQGGASDTNYKPYSFASPLSHGDQSRYQYAIWKMRPNHANVTLCGTSSYRDTAKFWTLKSGFKGDDAS